MRLLPDSLFWRLFGAIIAAIAITFMIILALIVRERRQITWLESSAVMAVVAETIENAAKLPPEERSRVLEDLRARALDTEELRRRIMLAMRRGDREMLEQAMIARLQQRLGDSVQVRAGPPDGSPHKLVSLGEVDAGSPARMAASGFRPLQLEVVFADGETIVFRMPGPLLSRSAQTRIFRDLALITLALGIVLYVMTRTITRPLGQLAKAADAVGRGMSVEPLPEEGGRELRAATRAFNAMQERLRRYVDSRTRVLAAMSHDMRTPLTRMRLRVESIEDEQLRARFAADLDEMNRMMRGALAVFRGLNDEEPPVQVDIDALLESLRSEHVELGGKVTVSGRAAQPYLGKPLALKRCLGNLLENALRYGQEAHITVDDGAQLLIRIRDRGPGIPDEALDKVFEPFFRIEVSRNRGTGGAGLGLSIARDIAQAHGGSLSLRNLDQGLEAELALPRDDPMGSS